MCTALQTPSHRGPSLSTQTITQMFSKSLHLFCKGKEDFWGICSQMQLTLHDFKLLQCKRNVLSSFTISSHKGSLGRVSHVSAEDTNLSMYMRVWVYVCACV